MKCPDCFEEIQNSAKMCRFCLRGISEIDFRKCPHCMEMIRRAARKCRYCKSGLPPGAGAQGAGVPRNPYPSVDSSSIALEEPEKTQEEKQEIDYEMSKLRRNIAGWCNLLPVLSLRNFSQALFSMSSLRRNDKTRSHSLPLLQREFPNRNCRIESRSTRFSFKCGNSDRTSD